MKIIIQFLCAFCFIIFSSVPLMGGKHKSRTKWSKMNEFVELPQPKQDKSFKNVVPGKSWADAIKTPGKVEAKNLALNPESKGQEINTFDDVIDRNIISWYKREYKVIPDPILGNRLAIFFDAGQIESFNCANKVPVLVFDWRAVQHTLSPWFTGTKDLENNFVTGGHFAKYLEKYFFNTKNYMFSGTKIDPRGPDSSQHSRCKIILWGCSCNNDGELWGAIGMKAMFDESVRLFDVLKSAADSSFDICQERDGSTSFIFEETNELPEFKINVRGKDDVWYITSIYPMANNYESITANMETYFDTQFSVPDIDSINKIYRK